MILNEGLGALECKSAILTFVCVIGNNDARVIGGSEQNSLIQYWESVIYLFLFSFNFSVNYSFY